MDQRKQIQIGNEHFKQWLRSLHPVARVERMSAIAKTLATMSLRGSQIKAALAQLSQRCQVMMVKLSKDQINRYTRRSPLKRLQPSVHTSTINKQQKKDVKPMKTVICNVDKDKSCTSIRDDGVPPKAFSEKVFELEKCKSSSFVSPNVTKIEGTRSNLSGRRRISKKAKQIMKELFGEDDFEDTKCLGDQDRVSKGTSDKEVNKYVSTTVNVNIYNTSPNECLGSNPSITKRKHTENTMLTANEATTKMLRIDVSLSNEQPSENEKNETELIISQQKESPNLTGNVSKRKSGKKSSRKNSKRNNGSSKKSLKKPRTKSITNLSTTEEDPSIKELWSIFGMESPTDRSAKFYSNPLNFGNTETITLHTAPEEANATQSAMSFPQTNLGDMALDQLEESSNDRGLPESPNATQNEMHSDITEPFLKITDSFSLSETSARHCNGFHLSVQTENITNSDYKTHEDMSGHEKDAIKPDRNYNKPIFSIETISLDDGDETDDKETDKSMKEFNGIVGQNNEIAEKSKVGTIRVKNLGLLIDPQHQIRGNKGASIPTTSHSREEITSIIDVDQEDSSSNISQSNVEERFFATYSYYFDELLESKIPKLGELLHLAIADGIRCVERIKRAEQLSSEDLIKEEKQRAEKDFSDMIKIRGIEFSPLCETIVKKFEQSSKITLFIALFCRIFKHSEFIDPANKTFMPEAKNVMRLMLKKHPFKDKDILDTLNSDNEDFQEQVFRVRDLIEKYYNYNNSQTSSASCMPIANVCNNVTKKTLGKTKFSRAPTSISVPGTSKTGVVNNSTSKSQLGNTNTIVKAKQACFILPNTTVNGSQKNVFKNTTTNRNLSNSASKSTQRVIQKPTPNLSVSSTNTDKESTSACSRNPPKLSNGSVASQRANSQIAPVSAIGISNARPSNSSQQLNKPALIRTLEEIVNTNSNKPSTCGSQKNNSINVQMRPQVVTPSTYSPADFHKGILKRHLETPAKVALLNRITAKNVLSNIATQSTSSVIQVSRASPISFAIVSIPQNTIATSSSSSGISTAKTFLHGDALHNLRTNFATSTPTCGPSLNMSLHVSDPNVTQTQSVSAPPQQSPECPSITGPTVINVTSNSNAFTGRNDTADRLHNNQKQTLEMLQRTVVQQPRPNVIQPLTTAQLQPKPNSVGPSMIVREVVDPSIPAIVGMDLNQIPRMHDEDLQTMAEKTAASPDGVSAVEGASSSNRPSNADDETTSRTAQPSMPSSSHCHPFIRRMPISGKMRMLFGNNSNN